MYYTGLDPRTMQPVYVPKNPHEKAMQRALMQYRDPKNDALVREALEKAGRTDLIGNGPKCLLRPRSKNAPSGKAAKPANKPDAPAKARAPRQNASKPAPVSYTHLSSRMLCSSSSL